MEFVLRGTAHTEHIIVKLKLHQTNSADLVPAFHGSLWSESRDGLGCSRPFWKHLVEPQQHIIILWCDVAVEQVKDLGLSKTAREEAIGPRR